MTSARACIIGAGSSGITAAKTLHQRGLPFDCFELGTGLGGNWRYRNDNGLSSAYRSLHINTSRDKMAYSDFPMPRDYPHYPHHSQILQYFEDYVDHFGFRDKISFETEVNRVEPAEGGGYEVTVTGPDGAQRSAVYGAVMVANGHHWDPSWPSFPGTLDGAVMHSHDYETPEGLLGKRVLVVGIGNSACDIVSEVSRVASATFLSTRRSAHVLPKYILGRTLDSWVTPASSYLPVAMQRRLLGLLVFLARGRQEAYGLRRPQHTLSSEHPTISSDLLNLVGHGRIQVKPDVERLLGDRVRFVDGSEEEVDVAIFATGYNVSFPFLRPELLGLEDNYLPLYQHVVPPHLPGLYFIGLIQPLGAVMPLAEAQSLWVADLLEGCAGLPSVAEMKHSLETERQGMSRRYVRSKRHTMQVDFYPYLRCLRTERQKGRRRPPQQVLAPPQTGGVGTLAAAG